MNVLRPLWSLGFSCKGKGKMKGKFRGILDRRQEIKIQNRNKKICKPYTGLSAYLGKKKNSDPGQEMIWPGWAWQLAWFCNIKGHHSFIHPFNQSLNIEYLPYASTYFSQQCVTTCIEYCQPGKHHPNPSKCRVFIGGWPSGYSWLPVWLTLVSSSFRGWADKSQPETPS